MKIEDSLTIANLRLKVAVAQIQAEQAKLSWRIAQEELDQEFKRICKKYKKDPNEVTISNDNREFIEMKSLALQYSSSDSDNGSGHPESSE